ncbi:response regulator [Sphingobium amiense]|uniref:Response regulator n=1 Tax=Sphingobium amiense TaxID=135719 RepID=A0A494W122_9SPHN|nr:response regulator [Sphingobium amiense]BBD97016.1 response regulator [Sphingobium amiense]
MSQKSIAIVDDDDYLRNALDNLVRSAGYLVVQFSSAEAFLARTCEAPPDLLLTDYNLGGIDGIELIRILRNSGDLIPALVMSAHDGEILRERALAAGALGFLEKPFVADHLLEMIEQGLKPKPSDLNGSF